VLIDVLLLLLLSNLRIGNGPYSSVVVGATTGISGAIDLTYADSSIITTGVTGGVQAGVTEQLKLTIVPDTNAAILANGKQLIYSIVTVCGVMYRYRLLHAAMFICLNTDESSLVHLHLITGLTVVVSLSTTDVSTGGCKLASTATNIATVGTASVTVTLPASGTDTAMMSDDSIYIHCSSVTPAASWPVISAAVTVSNGNAVTAFSGVALTVYDVPTQPTGVR
jgi:hypothetical protein